MRRSCGIFDPLTQIQAISLTESLYYVRTHLGLDHSSPLGANVLNECPYKLLDILIYRSMNHHDI